MIAALINRPCTIVSRSASADGDDYGNAIDTESTIDTVCEIQQRRRDEPADQGELSSTDWLGFFPAGTALDTGDAVQVDGERFELVGDPWPVRNPRTRAVSHIEASLRKVG